MAKFEVLGVTACPTGIAHTYMAAEKLKKAGKKAGIKVKVETNGSIGVENKLKDLEIAEAKAIIVAADTKVDMARFKGKKLIEIPVAKAIKNADELIKQALNGDFEIYNK